MSLILFGDAVQKTMAALTTLEGQLDKIINDHAPRAFAVLAEMTRKLAAGEIDMATFEQQFLKLQALNAQGGGFLGDLNEVLNEIRRKMSGLGDETPSGGSGSGGGGTGGTGSSSGSGDAGRGGEGGGAAGATSTGGASGPGRDAGRTLFNEVGQSGDRGLISSNIHVKEIVVTPLDRARILRELKDQIRRIRR